MSVGRYFARDYSEARQLFRDAATAAGARLEICRNPVSGPGGIELTTDVARLGPDNARNLLLTFSGTHGAEGFAGSGVQVGWLMSGLWREVPDDTAQVHVHANNPYGFAAISRTTEANVDLNRNFVDFAKPLPMNAGYREIRPIVCPEAWDDETPGLIRAGSERYVEAKGFWAFREAISAGQYEDPCGVFFGGDCPSWSRLNVERLIARHLAGVARLAVIDYHTGLGPRGFGERIVDHRPESAAYERAVDWYEGDCASPHLGTSASARLTGQMLVALERDLPRVEVTAIALEYGTLPADDVLGALCADNWLRFHGSLASPRGREIKAQVRDAFYQDAADWKSMIWERAVDTQRLALAGLKA